MLAGADLIEVFNGRAGGEANRRAGARGAVAKPGFWASDAHLAPKPGNHHCDGGKFG